MGYEWKLKNPFILLSIFSFIVIISYGNSAVGKIYESPFPYEALSVSLGSPGIIKMSCNSHRGYDIPVYGDYFSCVAEITDEDMLDDFLLTQTTGDLKAITLHYPESERLGDPLYEDVGGSPRMISNNSIIFPDIRIPIEPGFNEFDIQFKAKSVTNTGLTDHYFHSPLIKYEAISLESYNTRAGEKATLKFSIIILAVAFALSGVKNLMEIWDRKIN